MYASSRYAAGPRSMRGAQTRGPAVYLGYCQRSGRYRMMDLPEYLSNVQEGWSRLVGEGTDAYQGLLRDYAGGGAAATMVAPASSPGRGRACDCGCDDGHCECCVCDADVLVHARCGELRRIPLTFENDTRRERPVTLDLGQFASSGGRDLGWKAQLSETQFTLRPCDEHTVTLLVQIRCGDASTPNKPGTPSPEPVPGEKVPDRERPERDEIAVAALADRRFGSVDRCEVGYATLRAEGCLTRPVVVAVAVLPDDCDAYRHPCGCGCCH